MDHLYHGSRWTTRLRIIEFEVPTPSSSPAYREFCTQEHLKFGASPGILEGNGMLSRWWCQLIPNMWVCIGFVIRYPRKWWLIIISIALPCEIHLPLFQTRPFLQAGRCHHPICWANFKADAQIGCWCFGKKQRSCKFSTRMRQRWYSKSL